MSAELESVTQLRQLYPQPRRRSIDKEVDHLDEHCRDFIAHSPFLVLGTTDGRGRVDVSPKGGPPGFAAVLDDQQLAVPDMAGNNRLDSMSNIVTHGASSALFVIPGLDETLRVVGEASVTTDESTLSQCRVLDLQPSAAVVIRVTTAFIHCAKAFRRSGLWEPERWPETQDMATPACILRDHIGLEGTVADSQRALDQSYAESTWKMGGHASVAPRG